MQWILLFSLINGLYARDDDRDDDDRKARQTPSARPTKTVPQTAARTSVSPVSAHAALQTTRPLLVNDTFTIIKPVPLEPTNTQQSRIHLNKIALIVGTILTSTVLLILAGLYLAKRLRRQVDDDHNSTLFSATKDPLESPISTEESSSPVRESENSSPVITSRVNPTRLSAMNIDQLQYIFPSIRPRSVVPSEFLFGANGDQSTIVADDSVSQVLEREESHRSYS